MTFPSPSTIFFDHVGIDKFPAVGEGAEGVRVFFDGNPVSQRPEGHRQVGVIGRRQFGKLHFFQVMLYGVFRQYLLIQVDGGNVVRMFQRLPGGNEAVIPVFGEVGRPVHAASRRNGQGHVRQDRTGGGDPHVDRRAVDEERLHRRTVLPVGLGGVVQIFPLVIPAADEAEDFPRFVLD